jgi:undecaprenyl-diphosphatase
MNIIQAILYGIIQGITEFLPISSTAHLNIAQIIMNPNASPEALKASMRFVDIALHLGTLAAVIIFFFKDWINLFKKGFTQPKSTDGKLFWYIILATIPSGIIALVFDKKSEAISNNLIIISIALIVLGIVLYFADKLSEKTVKLEKIGLTSSLLIGLSQAFALIPGVSRSGITITTGRLLKIDRVSAAKFTFLLSTPTLLGVGLYKAKDLLNIPSSDIFTFLIAILTSAIVGTLCIKFLLEFIKTKGFAAFAIYRCALGVGILVLVLMGVLKAY